MHRVLLSSLTVVVVLGVMATAAATSTTEVGITPKTVTIGATFPLTGPASSYGVIPAAFKAYIAYVNAGRGPDGKRGVGGRQIVFKYYDDGYNPATSIQNVRQLVEQDKVFAIVGALGTDVNIAIRPYLNANKVPQLFAASGATTFGRDTRTGRGRSGISRTTSSRAGSTGRRSRRTARMRRSPFSTRMTSLARTSCKDSKAASEPGRRISSARSPTR